MPPRQWRMGVVNAWCRPQPSPGRQGPGEDDRHAGPALAGPHPRRWSIGPRRRPGDRSRFRVDGSRRAPAKDRKEGIQAFVGFRPSSRDVEEVVAMNVKDRGRRLITGSGQGIGAGIAAVLGRRRRPHRRQRPGPLPGRRGRGSSWERRDAVTGVTSDVSTASAPRLILVGTLDALRSDRHRQQRRDRRDGWLVKMSEEDWDDVLRVNLKSQFCAPAPPLPR